jgi:hypothetical protein
MSVDVDASEGVGEKGLRSSSSRSYSAVECTVDDGTTEEKEQSDGVFRSFR